MNETQQERFPFSYYWLNDLFTILSEGKAYSFSFSWATVPDGTLELGLAICLKNLYSLLF